MTAVAVETEKLISEVSSEITKKTSENLFHNTKTQFCHMCHAECFFVGLSLAHIERFTSPSPTFAAVQAAIFVPGDIKRTSH